MAKKKVKATAATYGTARLPAPVTVTTLAGTPCGRCGVTVRYRPVPGAAAAALTGHYQAEHPDPAVLVS